MRGGPRPGAGRPKGAKNRRSQVSEQLKREIAESGRDPVEYMLAVMKSDPDPNRRLEAARGAAPYLRPRLSQTELKQQDSFAHKSEEEVLQSLAQMLAQPEALDVHVRLLTATQEQLELTKTAFGKRGLRIVPAEGQVTHISAGGAGS